MKVYSVVELVQNEGSEKILDDNRVYSSRESALKYLHDTYLGICNNTDCAVGEADYNDDGWYVIVDKEGTTYEGFVSEGLEILS